MMNLSGARAYLPVKALISSRILTWLVITSSIVGIVKIFDLNEISEVNTRSLLEAKAHSALRRDWGKASGKEVPKPPGNSSRLDPKKVPKLAVEKIPTVKPKEEEKGKADQKFKDPDYFPYRYLINEENTCNRLVRIINIVPIAPGSIHSRFQIRKLWGSSEHLEKTGMKTLFLIGLTHSSNLQDQIESESLTYRDIIQMDFVDSYLNLTLKTLSILHWTKEYCSSAQWVLKSDEDVFINPFALADYLTKNGKGRDFVCRMNANLKVCRLGDDCPVKWTVSKEQYPFDYYPPYCDGPAYVISTRIIQRLYANADKTHPHVMEDAYFTGIIAKPLWPRYKKLRLLRFPRFDRYIKRRHWRGTSLMILFKSNKIDFNLLWNKIIEFRNGDAVETL